jgi:hypothetical protein
MVSALVLIGLLPRYIPHVMRGMVPAALPRYMSTMPPVERPMDTPTNFSTFIEQERERIKEAMRAARAKRQEAEAELERLDAQSGAIAAYEAALKGKKVSSPTGAPRASWGEKRSALLTLIGEHPDGMTRAEIIDAMQAHGDQSASQSISNALAALKKQNKLTQDGKRYVVRQQ